MFEAAIQAAASVAREWTPARADPAGQTRCCHLCLRRYRVLVLDGPLHDLPHGVAHATVVAVDGLIADRLQAADRFEQEPWTVLLNERDRELEVRRRSDMARGSLMVVALEELGRADAVFSELRRQYTEPAMARFLAQHRMNGVPEAWV